MAQSVFPTKSNLMQTRKTLSFAKVGFELLDRKRNILMREVSGLLNTAAALREQLNAVSLSAYAALEQAMVTREVHPGTPGCVPIDEGLTATVRSVMGVEIPLLTLEQRQSELWYPLSDTGPRLDEAVTRFEEMKRLAVQTAQVESDIYRLAAAIKKTQTRANALKNIIIPDLTASARFIADSLEEKEREEFSRLKVIKQQKNENFQNRV